MSRRKRDPNWTPFFEIPIEWFLARLDEKGWRNNGSPFDTPTAIYENSRYQVSVHTFPPDTWPGVSVEVKQLSIKRLDKREISDWRDMQRIKTEIAGAEVEAIRLCPAESRLVDTANQYHLWCLPPGQAFPFGYFDGRIVAGPRNPGGLEPNGSRQRSFEDPVEETFTGEQMDAIIRHGPHDRKPNEVGDACAVCGIPPGGHR